MDVCIAVALAVLKTTITFQLKNSFYTKNDNLRNNL